MAIEWKKDGTGIVDGEARFFVERAYISGFTGFALRSDGTRRILGTKPTRRTVRRMCEIDLAIDEKMTVEVADPSSTVRITRRGVEIALVTVDRLEGASRADVERIVALIAEKLNG